MIPIIEKQFTNFMGLKMTINEIEERLYVYLDDFTACIHVSKALILYHGLGTIIESSDGIYLIGSLFSDDIAKNTELHRFLCFFNYTQVLRINLGDDYLGYIYKLHGFKDDIG